MRAFVGGSGRKSLARLATFVAEQKCFTIEISKNYRGIEFREDLKELYRVAGGQNKPTTFLFDETQIKYETFLEDINNILTSGEVPNLFGKDEITGVVDEVCIMQSTGHSIWQLFDVHGAGVPCQRTAAALVRPVTDVWLGTIRPGHKASLAMQTCSTLKMPMCPQSELPEGIQKAS